MKQKTTTMPLGRIDAPPLPPGWVSEEGSAGFWDDIDGSDDEEWARRIRERNYLEGPEMAPARNEK